MIYHVAHLTIASQNAVPAYYTRTIGDWNQYTRAGGTARTQNPQKNDQSNAEHGAIDHCIELHGEKFSGLADFFVFPQIKCRHCKLFGRLHHEFEHLTFRTPSMLDTIILRLGIDANKSAKIQNYDRLAT